MVKKGKKRVVITIITGITLLLLYNIGVNIKRVWDYKTNIDKENILQYVEFIGEVSDINKERVKKVMQEQVSDEALNYIVNSGGKIRIVYCEDKDITDYFNKNYNMNVFNTVGNWDGVTVPFNDIFGNLRWADVVVQCNDMGIGELAHELGHVYDISHNDLAEQKEFIEKIYNKRSTISEKVMSGATMYRDYYESSPKEYFAELYKRYNRGDFKKGINEEMDTVIEYFESLGINKVNR